MRVILSLLLIILAVLSYFIVATQFGLFQRYPWVHFALGLAGLYLLVHLIRRKFTMWRLGALFLGVLLLGAFVWYTLIYSTYPTTTTAFVPGDQIDSTSGDTIVLKSMSGDPFHFREEIARQPLTVLVFYRGIW